MKEKQQQQSMSINSMDLIEPSLLLVFYPKGRNVRIPG